MSKIIKKTIPHDNDAEQSVVGSLLVDGYCMGSIINILVILHKIML